MESPNVLWQVLMIALAVSAISTTVSLSSLFSPVRRWATKHFRRFSRLISCAYCSSHWIAFFAVAWFNPRVFDGWVVANWFTVVFAVVAVANVFTGVIRKLNFFSDDPQHESGETDAGTSQPAAAGGKAPAPDGEGASADARTV